MNKENKGEKSGRRGFFFRMLAGAGVASAALFAARNQTQEVTLELVDSSEIDPILYRRTEETERYYRTLYT